MNFVCVPNTQRDNAIYVPCIYLNIIYILPTPPNRRSDSNKVIGQVNNLHISVKSAIHSKINVYADPEKMP